MSPSQPPAHKPPPSVEKVIGPTGTESQASAEHDGVPPPGAAAREGSALTRAQLERFRERDPEAMAALFEAYFDRVYGLVYRLLGDRPAAEDMTQEVFLKVHRAAHQLDPSRDPGPWLTAIAYNACRDLWRSGAYRISRRSGSIEGDPVLAGRLTGGSNDPERDLLVRERRDLVLEAIQRLPQPLREVVVLYDYQGLSHQEIADLTGINHAAARKRYSRALTALGKMLKERYR